MVVVPRGAPFTLVAQQLEEAGIVRSARDFSYLASWKRADRRVKAGEYHFSQPVRPLAVLDKLVRGEMVQYRLTIPEGYTVREIGVLLEEQGLAVGAEFVAKARDGALVASMGFKGVSLEGYLFPDTYRFTKGLPVEEIIAIMVERFKEVYGEVVAERAAHFGFSQQEVVTLASIIEKETGKKEERRHISAVFHNRLRRGIALQSDPTVIYGIKDFDGNLTRNHLRTRTPYNTYRMRGLPPGPIANPGKGALAAAVEPVVGDYLYFVSKNDGTHYFSRSLKEHNRAVDKYQKSRKYRNGSSNKSSKG